MSEQEKVQDSGTVETVEKMWEQAVGNPPESGMSFLNNGGTSLAGLRLLGAIRHEFGIRMQWRDLHLATDARDFATRVLEQTPR